MLPQLSNMLNLWQWALLAAVPPAIVVLYFLKLKRTPLVVPSTYLWRKSIEDLHVNSLWQKLRQSLLLFLQLFIVMLAMLALIRPIFSGSSLVGNRFIFLIDASASMGASDIEPTRLAEAKQRTLEMIDAMGSRDQGMVVSFSDSALVEQEFTTSRNDLRRAVNNVKQTQRPTDLREALRVAAGLANPGRISDPNSQQDVQVAEALPATLYILSDGKMQPVKDFSLGNLEPQFIRIGIDEPENLGIVSFGTRYNEEKIGQLQAFGRIENSGAEEQTVEAELRMADVLLDAQKVTVPPRDGAGVVFELEDIQSGALELRIAASDHLAVDNKAWAAVNPPRRVRVLFVTPGNEPLARALGTGRAAGLADLVIQPPAFVTSVDYRKAAANGDYDLVIYDRAKPEELPRANTLFIAELPPGDKWTAGEPATVPQIIDTDKSHPFISLIELGNVDIVEATPLTFPPGGSSLIDTTAGSVFAIAPRDAFEDAVMGFEIVGDGRIGTNWPLRPSFPVFILSLLDYFAGTSDSAAVASIVPGNTIELKSLVQAPKLDVVTPARRTQTLTRGTSPTFQFSDTDSPGAYDVLESGEITQRFTVNLFSGAESDIAPAKQVEIGWEKKAGETKSWDTSPLKAWKWILLAALAVLLFEWYIYNRRVYL